METATDNSVSLSSSGLPSTQFHLSQTPEQVAEVVKFWEGKISPDKTKSDTEILTNREDSSVAGANSFSGACACSSELGGGATSQKQTPSEEVEGLQVRAFSSALTALTSAVDFNVLNFQSPPSTPRPSFYSREAPSENTPVSIPLLSMTYELQVSFHNLETERILVVQRISELQAIVRKSRARVHDLNGDTARFAELILDERQELVDRLIFKIQMCSSLLLDKGSEENSTVCTQSLSPISHLKNQVPQLEEENECIQAPMQRLQEMMHQSGLPSDQRKVWQEISQVNEASSTFVFAIGKFMTHTIEVSHLGSLLAQRTKVAVDFLIQTVTELIRD